MEELEHKRLENDPIAQTMFSPDNYSNKPSMKDGFLFESPSSKGFLQDFHYFDQFHANGSSSNPMFGTSFESLDVFPYGSSSTNMEFYDYECKPFVENGGFMDNFQNGANLNLVDRNSMGLLGSNLGQIPIKLQEMKPTNLVAPDEVSSCVTVNNHLDYNKKVGGNKNRALNSATRRTWKGRKKNNVVKGQWTIEEDRLLTQLVEQYGLRKWSHIAQKLPGRIGKQCRERWHNHLRPDIKKDVWSEEEDMVLIQAHKDIGNKWAEIAKRLPGRTENSIKNHWNATKRRQYSKRKCRSKYPRGTLLQEYIKSLTFDSSSGPKCKFQVKTSAADDDSTVKAPNLMQELSKNNGLVPNCEMVFDFDEKMFEDGCSFDSLLDDIACVHVHQHSAVVVDEKSFEMDVSVEEEDMGPIMDFEVKKELDLVEMISQSKM